MSGPTSSGLCGPRFEWAYILGAVRPATGDDFALVPPVVSLAAMGTFLAAFARTIPADTHVVLVLDQAGWHSSRRLCVPDRITLVPLPSYAPELNPVERVWLYLREQVLSHRVLEGYEEIVSACCEAWNSLTAQRLRALCNHPWIAKVTS